MRSILKRRRTLTARVIRHDGKTITVKLMHAGDDRPPIIRVRVTPAWRVRQAEHPQFTHGSDEGQAPYIDIVWDDHKEES